MLDAAKTDHALLEVTHPAVGVRDRAVGQQLLEQRHLQRARRERASQNICTELRRTAPNCAAELRGTSSAIISMRGTT